LSSAGEQSKTKLRFPLPDDIRRAIIEHARSDAPRECCGVLVGHSGQADRIYALRNIAEGNRFYEIDPVQLIELEFHELPKDDSEIVAIYHSHPESPAYPSRTDVELAFWPEAVYLICSLEFPDDPIIRGFEIRDGNISELTLAP
jgi:[CysO sulfur-carrier protein]-S-L-cysteine hydrolase